MAKIGQKSKKDLLAANAHLPITKADINFKAHTDEDYEYARELYKELLETGRHSLKDLVTLAAESEHPRAFEVLSASIKNLSDVTDKLMTLQKDVKAINQIKTPGQTPGLTQNNIFCGSTKELARLFEKENEKIINHDS